MDPKALLGRLRLAARCNVAGAGAAAAELTTNGEPVGLFSVDSAKRFTDLYAAVLPADTIKKYRKGDAQAYFDRAAPIGQRLGLKVVVGLNTENCYEVGVRRPCTAADIVRFGGMAVGMRGAVRS